MFEPKLYITAIPILVRKIIGITDDSKVRPRIIRIKILAASIYRGTSLSAKSLVSLRIPHMPLKKACFPAILLMEDTAF
ncbi:hypothetical protein SDC9_133789 [bioreactor metagenome]|uniref:Uncharacterized protein n=1 Tax=bioreactor metagenome TaxID=1076179 RepID=A0A645DCF6_9ZZZZ